MCRPASAASPDRPAPACEPPVAAGGHAAETSCSVLSALGHQATMACCVGEAGEAEACRRSSAVWGRTRTESSVSTERVPKAPGLELAHVVAGDVLDDLAARLPGFAAAVDGGEAKEDGRAGRRHGRACGPAGVGGDRAAERGLGRACRGARDQSGGSKARVWWEASPAGRSMLGQRGGGVGGDARAPKGS